MTDGLFIAVAVGIGHVTHSTERKTESCNIAEKLYGTVIKCYYTKAGRTEQHPCAFVAHQRKEDRNALRTAKYAQIFDRTSIVVYRRC